MANSGKNTNGSQFFIMNEDYPLPPNYTIFGKVTEGLETVDAIAGTPVTRSASGENSKPTEPVTINSIKIQEN
jgi:cyclophilin family peptidyl-prolyl cis-trans isomerase